MSEKDVIEKFQELKEEFKDSGPIDLEERLAKLQMQGRNQTQRGNNLLRPM